MINNLHASHGGNGSHHKMDSTAHDDCILVIWFHIAGSEDMRSSPSLHEEKIKSQTEEMDWGKEHSHKA